MLSAPCLPWLLALGAAETYTYAVSSPPGPPHLFRLAGKCFSLVEST